MFAHSIRIFTLIYFIEILHLLCLMSRFCGKKSNLGKKSKMSLTFYLFLHKTKCYINKSMRFRLKP